MNILLWNQSKLKKFYPCTQLPKKMHFRMLSAKWPSISSMHCELHEIGSYVWWHFMVATFLLVDTLRLPIGPKPASWSTTFAYYPNTLSVDILSHLTNGNMFEIINKNFKNKTKLLTLELDCICWWPSTLKCWVICRHIEGQVSIPYMYGTGT